MHTRRGLTDAEREHRREQDRERLHEAAQQLLSSDGWQRWIRVRARGGLARLSLNNQLLVALSCPDATFVAGFKAWLSLGYCVRKGEKGIRIIAPMPINNRQSERAEGSAGEDRPRVLFKAVSVFDRSQVAPLDGVEQAPLEPPCEPLTGDSHAHLLAPLRAFTESIGFTVAFESIPGSTGGWCDRAARRIVVDASQAANARLRILIHETIHALGIGYAEYGRERAEVIVDTATYVVAASVGLDVGGESVPYVAGWGETGALQAVTAFASTIDELARRVETVLAAGVAVGNIAA
jgi:N-terminal domain of anti-restriction factor ArdC